MRFLSRATMCNVLVLCTAICGMQYGEGPAVPTSSWQWKIFPGCRSVGGGGSSGGGSLKCVHNDAKHRSRPGRSHVTSLSRHVPPPPPPQLSPAAYNAMQYNTIQPCWQGFGQGGGGKPRCGSVWHVLDSHVPRINLKEEPNPRCPCPSLIRHVALNYPQPSAGSLVRTCACVFVKCVCV